MRVNIDLTKTNGDNDIADELLNNVGASAFTLEHDFFYGSTDLKIWTAAGETGTQLVETTDYDLGGLDTDLTTRAGVNIYSTITVTNVTYQTGNLYFTYHACADFVDALDRYNIVRGAGSTLASILMSATGTIEINSGSSAVDAFEVNSAGGAEFYLSGTEGFYVEDSTNFAYFYLNPTSGAIDLDAEGSGGYIALYSDLYFIDLTSGTDIYIGAGENLELTSGLALDVDAGTDITIDTAGDGDTIVITSNRSTTPVLNTRRAILTLDQQTSGAILQGFYSGTSLTGPDVTITTENESAGGTGGDVNLTTTATAGTPGNVSIVSNGYAEMYGGGTSGGYVYLYDTGEITIGSENSQPATFSSNGGAMAISGVGGNITVSTNSTGRIILTSAASTATDAIDINATAGGIDIDAATDIVATATGVGSDITLKAVISEAGTGGNLTLQTQTTDGTGTSGNVIIGQASGPGPAGNIQISTENSTASAIDINTDGGIDIDSDSFALNTLSGNIVVNSGANTQIIFNGQHQVTDDAGYTVALFNSANKQMTFTVDHNTATAASGIALRTAVNNAGGNGGDIILETNVISGTAGRIRLDSANTSITSIDFDTVGGIDIDAGASSSFVIAGGDFDLQTTTGDLTIDAAGASSSLLLSTNLATISMPSTGTISVTAGLNQDLTLGSSGASGEIIINTASTAANAVDINATAGGIDIDASGVISLNSSGSYIELLGDVRLPGSAPSSPAAGSVYFNAGTDTLFIYNGTAWVSEVLTV